MKRRLTYFLFAIVFVAGILSGVRAINAESTSPEEQAVELKDIRDQVIIKFEASTSNTPRPFGREDKAPSFAPEPQKTTKKVLPPWGTVSAGDHVELLVRTALKEKLLLFEKYEDEYDNYIDDDGSSPISGRGVVYTIGNYPEAKEKYSKALKPESITRWSTDDEIKVQFISHGGAFAAAKENVRGGFETIRKDLEEASGIKIREVDGYFELPNLTVKFPTGWSHQHRRNRSITVQPPEKECGDCPKTYFVNESMTSFTNFDLDLLYTDKYFIRKAYCHKGKSFMDDVSLNKFIRECMVSALGLPGIATYYPLNWKDQLDLIQLLYDSKISPGMNKQDIYKALHHHTSDYSKLRNNTFPLETDSLANKLYDEDPIKRFLQVALKDRLILYKKYTGNDSSPIYGETIVYSETDHPIALEKYPRAISPNRLVRWPENSKIAVYFGAARERENEVRMKAIEHFKKIKRELQKATGLQIYSVDDSSAANIRVRFPTDWSHTYIRNHSRFALPPKKGCTHCGKYLVESTSRFSTSGHDKKEERLKEDFRLDLIYEDDYTISKAFCRAGIHKPEQFIQECLVSALGLPSLAYYQDMNFNNHLQLIETLYRDELKPGMDAEEIKSVFELERD